MTANRHITGAREYLQMADEAGDWTDTTRTQQQWAIERYHAHAQVQATLAIAEEQRTVSLLALYRSIDAQGDMPDHAAELFNMIAPRLGLRDDEWGADK